MDCFFIFDIGILNMWVLDDVYELKLSFILLVI